MARAETGSYEELVKRSIDHPEWFWPLAIDDMGLEFSRPWEKLLDTSRGIELPTWFNGGTVNIAQNCVHRWAKEELSEAPAAIFAGEDGTRYSLTFAELSDSVTRLAEGLITLGVKIGDRVATYLPMSPEAAIASHACAHIGAIHVPIFSGFAASAIAQRLKDSEARVVITANASLRRGNTMPMKKTVDEAIQEAPSVEHVVIWHRMEGEEVTTTSQDVCWEELISNAPGKLEPLELDTETPYLLIYTSGTTGKPKGTLHVQGGFLVGIAREAIYQADAKPGDVFHFATDMGWIMGPWTVVGAGAAGSTVVYSEGAPDWPKDRLWKLIEQERVTLLGLSPTLVRSLIPHGDPKTDMTSLRAMITTGEPWNPGPYEWLFEKVGGSRCPIINCSGGTEVGACFLSPTPAIPIKPLSLGFPALGMDMDIVDSNGDPIRGEVGELICRKPWPGMTRGFWRDEERYLDTYWRQIPGVWVHGDWASVDEDGYWFLHGRSDDTLNIAGKRIGPSELESAAIEHAEVIESAAVGIPDEVKGEVSWIFCVTQGNPDTEKIAIEVADLIGNNLGKAFRPARVLCVQSLPKTRSAKIVRRAVRAAALGDDPGDISSIENPEAIDSIACAI